METVQLTSFENPGETLKVTPLAVERILEARAADPELNEKFAIRVAVKGGGCSGFVHELNFDDEVDPEEDIVQVLSENPRLDLVIDSFSALYLKGVNLDFVAEGFSEGFKFEGGTNKVCGCGQSFSV